MCQKLSENIFWPEAGNVYLLDGKPHLCFCECSVTGLPDGPDDIVRLWTKEQDGTIPYPENLNLVVKIARTEDGAWRYVSEGEWGDEVCVELSDDVPWFDVHDF